MFLRLYLFLSRSLSLSPLSHSLYLLILLTRVPLLWAQSAVLGSANLGLANLGSPTLGSANLGSANLGSAILGLANLSSATLGPANPQIS